ncbi:unnamed protein product [Brachionus calyciflorus]|uniref:Tudor domain-containing protein n=1 Tax=Brachionus calyciflorus TaxID=104777 RepID=A0A814RAV0_9BILA|nr:unnamed protein product [Brachionus calyciflorus]
MNYVAGRIENILPNTNECLVRLVDYGGLSKVELENLYCYVDEDELENQSKIDFLAINCIISRKSNVSLPIEINEKISSYEY